MTEKSFSLNDQQRFAALSGDRNPLHLDDLAARRLMLGGAVVHGINLLLWSMDCLAGEVPLSGFARLRVNFDRGLLVGETAVCEWRSNGSSWTGRITAPTGVVMRATIEPEFGPITPWNGMRDLQGGCCSENDISDLATRRGTLPLSLPPLWEKIFPSLAKGFAPEIVSILLGTTRLVGMECPGLHSIYSALRLNRISQSISPARAIEYQVSRADSRVRLLDINVEAGPYRGVIGALIRPKPVRQVGFSALRDVVEPDQFARQRALVVGGTRGLGELAAKLLAIGGADVTLTWHRGEAEARELVKEARNRALRLEAIQFDVAAPPQSSPPPSVPFTHLYYFATPYIRPGSSGRFNSTLFSQFLAYYVENFAGTLAWFASRATRDACVWYPSTVFISEMNSQFAEYRAAKECGETLCRLFSQQLAPMRFITPRLPRMLTDQTQSLARETLPDPVSILRESFLKC